MGDDPVVRSVRKTASGDVLLELRGRENTSRVLDLVQEQLGPTSEVRALRRVRPVTVMGLDETITLKEVADKVREVTGSSIKDEDVRGRYAMGALVSALVICSPAEAAKLVAAKSAKIGWLRVRFAERRKPLRCGRCLMFGHHRTICKGIDRTDCCRDCGERGHVAANCKSPPRCVACVVGKETETAHYAGSAKCRSAHPPT